MIKRLIEKYKKWQHTTRKWDKDHAVLTETVTNDDGSLQSVVQYIPDTKNEKQMLKHGKEELYDHGTILSRTSYANGQKEGTAEIYEHGTLLSVVTHKYGEKHGKETILYPDGNKKRETDYVYGKKSGKDIKYSANGTVLQSTEYYQGRKNGFEVIDGKTTVYDNDELRTGTVDVHQSKHSANFLVCIKGQVIGPRIYDHFNSDNSSLESFRQNCLLNAAIRARENNDMTKFNQIFERAMREKELLNNPQFTNAMEKVYKSGLADFKADQSSSNRNEKLRHFQETFLRDTLKLSYFKPEHQDELAAAMERAHSNLSPNPENPVLSPSPKTAAPQQQNAAMKLSLPENNGVDGR